MLELLLNFLDQKNLVNIPDKKGFNVLFYAIRIQNGLPILRILMQKDYVNLGVVDKVITKLLCIFLERKNTSKKQLKRDFI